MSKTDKTRADVELQRALTALAVRESVEKTPEGIQAGLNAVKSDMEEMLAKAMVGEDGAMVKPGAFVFARIDYDTQKASGMFASSGSLKALMMLARMIDVEISKRARARGFCDCSNCLAQMEIGLVDTYLAKDQASKGVLEA